LRNLIDGQNDSGQNNERKETVNSVNNRITENMAVALGYARHFAIGRAHLRHEMISEAFWILTEAAHKFADRHDNFAGYLRVRLRCGLIDFINQQDDCISYVDITPCNDDHLTILLNDLFDTGWFTADEQRIILDRLDGLTDKEIAENLQVSQVIINRRRHVICQKVLEKGDHYGLGRSKKSVHAKGRRCPGTGGGDPLGPTSDPDAGSDDPTADGQDQGAGKQWPAEE